MTVPASNQFRRAFAGYRSSHFLSLALVALAYFAAVRVGLAFVVWPEGLAGF